VTAEQAAALERCVSGGGVALFPADTVYGLAVDPESQAAVDRLYRIKGRPPRRPAAVMFFALDAALAALPELGERTREALERLLPGPVTAVVPNPARRYPLACADAPERVGIRVPAVVAGPEVPVLQSSANPSGGSDARRLEDVDAAIRGEVDLEIDGGQLPGTASSVIDLTGYERGGDWLVLREGALPIARLRDALG
jgi:L-threonylcarbamoyladenylate synthase